MPSTALQIVPIGPSELAHHLDALAELLCACVRNGASVSFIVPFGVDEARAFWSDQVAPSLACKKRTMLIALVEGELAGTVQLDVDMPPNQQHRAEVAKLLVHPVFRHRGIGRALMERLEACAVRENRWLLTLDTATAFAEELYCSLGYVRAGIIPQYARDPLVERYDATTLMFKTLPHAAPTR